ncbi:MAG: PaaI family thioesterase [Anaerolineae bacterium]
METVYDLTSSARFATEGALQPNSRGCFGCGVENSSGLRLRFYNDGIGEAHANVIFEDQHQGYPGIAHGGVVATALDEAMVRSVLSGDFARLYYTARIEVRYRQPVPLNVPLIVRGKVEKDRGRIVNAIAEVVLPNGLVAAEASGTLVQVPSEQLEQMNTPEVGWRVYDDLTDE